MLIYLTLLLLFVITNIAYQNQYCKKKYFTGKIRQKNATNCTKSQQKIHNKKYINTNCCEFMYQKYNAICCYSFKNLKDFRPRRTKIEQKWRKEAKLLCIIASITTLIAPQVGDCNHIVRPKYLSFLRLACLQARPADSKVQTVIVKAT